MIQILNIIVLVCASTTVYTNEEYPCRREITNCLYTKERSYFDTNRTIAHKCIKEFIENNKKKD